MAIPSKQAQGDQGPFQAFYPGTSQTVTFNGTSASTATAFTKSVVRLHATEACFIKIGLGSQTATTSHMFLPADTTEYFGIGPGYVIAVIEGATGVGGTLYVTEGD